MTKILVLYHSLYGHIQRMAEAIAKGAKKTQGVDVKVVQVPETLTNQVVEKMGAKGSKEGMKDIPIVTEQDLIWADAIIFGTPTRFGNMSASMRSFLDSTGALWSKGALIGKVGSVFVSTGTQHGGQESTILSFHTTLLHHGMVVVGVPYSEKRQMTIDEVSGGSPYGATTIAGSDGGRLPSENELAIAETQGNHVANIAKKLSST